MDYSEEQKDLSKIENMMVRKYRKNEIAALPYVELILLIQGKSSKFYTKPKMPFENRDLQSGYSTALVSANGKRVYSIKVIAQNLILKILTERVIEF